MEPEQLPSRSREEEDEDSACSPTGRSWATVILLHSHILSRQDRVPLTRVEPETLSSRAQSFRAAWPEEGLALGPGPRVGPTTESGFRCGREQT